VILNLSVVDNHFNCITCINIEHPSNSTLQTMDFASYPYSPFDNPLEKRYNVFQNHPKSADENITVRGSKFYWAIFAIMLFSTMCFVVWSYRKPRQDRPFHYLIASVTMGAYHLLRFPPPKQLGWSVGGR